MGAGYTNKLLCRNRLTRFRGQKGACLSKESPLLTFTAETQPQSNAKSLAMSHAHKNTHSRVHSKNIQKKLILQPGQNKQLICWQTHNQRTKQTEKTCPGVVQQVASFYSEANSNYYQVVYLLHTFLCRLKNELISWVKAFSLFSAVADSEKAPARVL